AWVLRFSCSAMAGLWHHLMGDEFSSTTALILKAQWWPWLLFVAASVCAVATALGAKRQTLLILAIIILLVDIIGLAFTLFCIAWAFAMPMWGLSPSA
ncbi:MAG: hypothetical protein ACYS18_06500, partial [Planctomycetota bacterium]